MKSTTKANGHWGTNLLNQTHELTLGSGSCKLTLHATAGETLVQ